MRPTDLYMLMLFLSFTVGIVLAHTLATYCEPCIVEPEETVEERNARGVAMEAGHRHATEQAEGKEHRVRTENKLPDKVTEGGGASKLAGSELEGEQSKTDPPSPLQDTTAPQENDEPSSVEEEQRASLASFLRRVSLASLTKQEQFEQGTEAHTKAKAILKAGKLQSARLQVTAEQHRTRRLNKANKWRNRNREWRVKRFRESWWCCIGGGGGGGGGGMVDGHS